MSRFKKAITVPSKALLGLFRFRLIEPIEVFYLKDTDTFYPIISKSGCSSIKVTLIRQYNKKFVSNFPEIHQIDPTKVTNNKVERFVFYNSKSYLNFSKGKNICLILRDPYARFYSCYQDIIKEKNIMHNLSVGLHKIKNFSYDNFLSIIFFIPDYLSDRHFRSQSFYFSKKVQKAVQKSTIMILEDYLYKNTSSDDIPVKINANNWVIPHKILLKLKNSGKFQKRYQSDILLFNKEKSKV